MNNNIKYDAIIIPGGGLNPLGELPVWVQKRFDRAIELYSGQIIIALSAGTTHKPLPLDEQGLPIYEAVAGARYLKKQGIPSDKILVETSSFDTIGNAFFTRLIHIQPRRFKNLLIITSNFHLPRTQAIFEWVFNLDIENVQYNLCFEGVNDEGLSSNVLNARIQKESKNLQALQGLINTIMSFEELHHWLFTQHKAYAPFLKPTQTLNEELSSY